MLTLFVRFAVIALIGYVLWRIFRPRHGARIVIDQHGVKHHEGLPRSHRREILEFMDELPPLDGTLTVCAQREPNGYLRLDFRGRVDPGTRQQIRNFLNTVM